VCRAGRQGAAAHSQRIQEVMCSGRGGEEGEAHTCRYTRGGGGRGGLKGTIQYARVPDADGGAEDDSVMEV